MSMVQCTNDDEIQGLNGKLALSITDAPIDDENIEGVFLTFERIEVRSKNDGWKTLEEFDEPVTIDLLSYQNGESYFLTEKEMPADTYDEIRLVLDMSQEGTYILYKDGAKQQLKVPSGSQSGYKVKGEFVVPIGGVVNLTLDWDLRKAIVKAGNSGMYILKPTVRLIANNDASMIRGEVADSIGLEKIIVYAYNDGTFTEAEYEDVATEEDRFLNAITSGAVDDNGRFTLAFLSHGIYDLYFVEYDTEGNFVQLAGEHQDVILTAGEIEEVEVLLDNE